MISAMTTEDMVEKGCKYGFLVVELGKTKYGTVIGNATVQLMTPKDPGGYNKTIQAKDSSFDRSKRRIKNTQGM